LLILIYKISCTLTSGCWLISLIWLFLGNVARESSHAGVNDDDGQRDMRREKREDQVEVGGVVVMVGVVLVGRSSWSS